jgi:Ca2+-transporting ATPase
LKSNSLSKSNTDTQGTELVPVAAAANAVPQPSAGAVSKWHTKTAAAALGELESCATGLTTARAAEVFQRFGPNALAEKPRPTFLERLWDQLNNALTWILLGAAVVSGAFLEWVEFGLILGVVSINVGIGMIQV